MIVDAFFFSSGESPSPDVMNEWRQMLKDQSSFQIEELDRWRKALNDAISLLKQVCFFSMTNMILFHSNITTNFFSFRLKLLLPIYNWW